jgi:putative FmdB family regulatory protein
MPTYEYVCNYCGQAFDVKASFAEKEKGLSPQCPTCANQDVQQVLRSVPFVRGSRGGGGCGCNPNTGCCGPQA